MASLFGRGASRATPPPSSPATPPSSSSTAAAISPTSPQRTGGITAAASRFMSGIGRVFASASQKSKDDEKKARAAVPAVDDSEEDESKDIKILILGPCLSGKSTVLKMAIELFRPGAYTRDERNVYRSIIVSNILQSIKILVTWAARLSYPIADEVKPAADRIEETKSDDIDRSMADDIMAIWQDQGIQATYAQRSRFQWLDSGAYFIQRVHQVIASGYVPTTEDILRSRVRTTGIVENEFTMYGLPFKMFDVGGARNERKKWIHCFTGVHVVIFTAAISEYDQTLYEDDRTNRLMEALTLFEEMVNTPHFQHSVISLWFTKRDEFVHKLSTTPLSTLFPDFEGEAEYERARRYLVDQFMARNRTHAQNVLIEVVDTTSVDDCRIAFEHIANAVRVRRGLDPIAPPAVPAAAAAAAATTAAATTSATTTSSSSGSTSSGST